MTKTSRAATHEGSCQICGRQQKLPGSVLSKHGYTTRWGFFSGVCPGAGHEPFEVSCDLIARYRDSAAEEAQQMRAEAAKQRAGEGHLYAEKRIPGRRWGEREQRVLTRVNVSADDKGLVTLLFDDRDNTEEVQPFYRKKQEVIDGLHRDHARRCEARAQQLEEYVSWQNERIANWKPGKLTPVIAEEPKASEQIGPGAVVHLFGKDGYDVTVLEIRTQQVRGCGPHLNGQYLPHIVYERNGRRGAYPMRLIRRTAIVKGAAK